MIDPAFKQNGSRNCEPFYFRSQRRPIGFYDDIESCVFGKLPAIRFSRSHKSRRDCISIYSCGSFPKNAPRRNALSGDTAVRSNIMPCTICRDTPRVRANAATDEPIVGNESS